MSTGPLLRVERVYNDRDDLHSRLSPPHDPSPVTRRKIRKKSIRNTKDSAEMARLKYQRQKPQGPLSPPSTSAAKMDRHFSIANVGSNGTMYLRPVARPYPRAFCPPPTPPDTSDAGFYWHDGLHESAAALTAHTQTPRRRSSFDSSYSRQSRHLSRDLLSGVRSPSADSSRLLSPPQQPYTSSQRPNTADPTSGPSLEVPIPSHRLGSPRFSDRGTAFLHNSFHTAFSSTTDLPALPKKDEQSDRLVPDPSPQAPHQNSLDLRRSPSVSWFSPSAPAADSPAGRPNPSPLAAPPLEQDRNIIPYTIYDKVAADPDNPAWVKYDEFTKSIIAATPARLVSEITSVKFLDYDLLSDFFLTYRAFLSPSDLARYLIARLRWAVSQTHESGRIVRVRTFVALRHWTLNYFTQDFEPDHDLRILFCELVNGLASDLQRRPEGGGGDLQVLGELQKCWNRTCALVWSSLDKPQAYDPLRLDSDDSQQIAATTRMRTLTGDTRMKNSSFGGSNATLPLRRHQTSASEVSEASLQVTSCSFPKMKRPKPDLKVQVHPDKSSHHLPKKVHEAFHRHKRSDSFSDALRDSRLKHATAPLGPAEEPETLIPVRPGRLIRGLVIHPRSANFVGPAPPSPPFFVKPEDTRPSLAETLLKPPETNGHSARNKLFGSVRRALSTRNAPKSSFSNRPKTSGSSDGRKREAEPQPKDMIRQIQARKAQGVHTDALAAMVMRSWEQQGNEDLERAESNDMVRPIMRKRSTTIHTDVPRRPGAARLDSSLTTSSRSILIMDDTGLSDAERTPDLIRTAAGTSEDQSHGTLQRQTTHELSQAALREMAMNNTAFLLPMELSKPMSSSSWASPTNSATLSIIAAPYSPPPSIPLPPLPTKSQPSAARKRAPTQPVVDDEPSPEMELAGAFDDAELGIQRESPQENSNERHVFRKSSLVDPSELHGPARQLRRRPGGNLREVDKVQDLGLLQRRQSTGSITSPKYSSPVTNIVSGQASDDQVVVRTSRPPLRTQATDGDLRSLRLLSTHSSLRNLGPSMEFEVAKIRAMPQHEDDGGVESALRKLEGRNMSIHSSNKTLKSFNFGEEEENLPALIRPAETGRVQVIGHPDHPETSRLDLESPSVDFPSNENMLQHVEESSLMEDDPSRFAHKRTKAVNIPDEPADSIHQVDEGHTAAKDFANSDQTQEFLRPVTPQGDREPLTSPDTPNSTFLLDDGESLMDRNSTISVHHAQKPSTDGARSFFFDGEDEEAIVDTPAGSPEQHSPEKFPPPAAEHPLTPPATADTLSDHGFDDFNVQLLLPGPPSEKPRKSCRLSELLTSDRFAKKSEPALPKARNLPTHHTPFILAHTSEALAMQFTLIEKDALDSVDWKDLINLNWSQEVPSVRDWAQYIHSFPQNVTDVSSIDLIITRFNLVIKWCISSILLCGTPEERAQCITKFIHIATHARRGLRNFATTAQITIALLSSDLSRLTKTWALVSQTEKNALRDLENLVSPMRNFAVLRAEMESAAAELGDDKDAAKTTTAAITGKRGVIPFLGVYTRDLALNAQKAAFFTPWTPPGEVAAAAAKKEKLVNFERHRTAASIVKGVLRLLDAGSRYDIKAEGEVLAKCLWLAALADTEISELSKGLEK